MGAVVRSVANALGNCSYDITVLPDPLHGEIVQFLKSRAASSDPTVLFCCEWALAKFNATPSLPQGVVLDKKLPYLKLLPDRLQARNDTYSPQTATGMAAVDAGRWQFEVTLASDGKGDNCYIHVGWARSDDSLIDGVGNSPLSYAYDASLGHKWTASKYEKYGARNQAKSGSVVGCYLDLDGGSIGFMLDGEDFGEAFQISSDQQLAPLVSMCPALTLGRFQQCVVNFGAMPLRFPLEGYRPIC